MSIDSEIMRISAGSLNAGTGDTNIAEASTPLGPGVSKYQGQLGRTLWVPPDQLISTASIGTLYGGTFRYVRLRAADAVNAAIGQIAFADIVVTNWQKAYQVTTNEDLSSSGLAGKFIAGVFISTLGYGKYWLIQIRGGVPVRMRATLSQTGIVGSAVYAAALNTGIGVADNAVADVLTPDTNPSVFSDVALMQQRYLGTAIAAPTSAGLIPVALDFTDPFAS